MAWLNTNAKAGAVSNMQHAGYGTRIACNLRS